MPVNERKLANGQIRYEARRQGKITPNCKRFWTREEAEHQLRVWEKNRLKYVLAKGTKEERAQRLEQFKAIQNRFLLGK